MSRRVLSLSAAFILALYGTASADGLSVGDAAPKLEVSEFVKGDAVKSFEKKKIYVVEFWATWCGPCRTSIPHLSELQKKNKDVVFIGVSVFEQDQSKIKPFVEEMGEKMAYRVAMDDVGTGKGNEGKMAKNWMIASEQSGIPTAFIVNGDAKIAWIGHPMQMEKPLEEIISGKWDLAKAKADFKIEMARKLKLRDLSAKIQKAQIAKDYKTVVAVVEDAVKDDPSMENMLGFVKFRSLVALGDADKITEYGNRLADKVFAAQPQGLNAIAWTLVEKPGEKPNPKLMKFALTMAEKADKLAEGKDGTIADTLAKAYYETGNFAKALENQERAVNLAKGTPVEKDPSMKGMLERLEMYKQKVANK
jgi:thiol-disulfide isomerase/thioredoxin